MVRHVATRSQRRMEKKQAVILLILILAASLVSFALGVVVGRSGARTAVAAAPAAPVRLAVGQPIPEPPAGGAAGEKRAESLTFYDSLPKGEQPPMGSGINLPPKKEAPSNSAAVTSPAKTPAGLPEKASAPPSTASAVAPAADKTPKPAKPQVPAASTAKGSAPAPAGGDFMVQAAAFRRSEDANSLKARLGKKGFAAFTQEAILEGKGTWYRVYVGPFASADAADAAVARLKTEEKLAAMVRKR